MQKVVEQENLRENPPSLIILLENIFAEGVGGWSIRIQTDHKSYGGVLVVSSVLK